MASFEEYVEYFLNSSSNIVHLETLEISHSAFTQTYYVVRNATKGITAFDEDNNEIDFEYYPLKVTPLGSKNDLDQAITITFGDLGEIIPTEMEEVSSARGFQEKPVVKYRTYRSDDLSEPLLGPIILEVASFAFTKTGCSFDAKAPSLNINRTGTLYKIERFPMLKALL